LIPILIVLIYHKVRNLTPQPLPLPEHLFNLPSSPLALFTSLLQLDSIILCDSHRYGASHHPLELILISVIEILEKLEQAISEVKLSGITTSFKAVGMEPMIRLVVHGEVDAAGICVEIGRRVGEVEEW
jgi:hypothetical protein